MFSSSSYPPFVNKLSYVSVSGVVQGLYIGALMSRQDEPYVHYYNELDINLL